MKELSLHEKVDFIIKQDVLKRVAPISEKEQLELIDKLCDGYSVIDVSWTGPSYSIDQKLSSSFYENIGYTKEDIESYQNGTFDGADKKALDTAAFNLKYTLMNNKVTKGNLNVKRGDENKIAHVMYKYCPIKVDSRGRVTKIIGIQYIL